MTQAHEAVWAALKAAPKPLTEERAAEIAAEALQDPKKAREFKDWLKSNFKHLETML